MPIIQLRDVWEMYRIKFIIDGKTSWENFWALKGITCEIEKGESVGIIGENGAGKSTILKLIMGLLKPDKGEIKISGKVSGLLELGAGFQTELTGRENIYLNAGLFGLTHSQIEEKYEEIINFTEIGKFINAPIKCYSQGMFVRLAFAIAIHVDPDILLIDDTLAVGDEYFQRKCIKKIFEIKDQGKTIIFVSHYMNMLTRLCNRTIFLKEGIIIKDNLTDKVIPLYAQTIGNREGVAVLESNPLNLIFNNGRLFINWQEKLLTPNSGAYTIFSVANKWYNSSQADWEVRRENERKIIASGSLYKLGLSQVWILEIINDYEIKWDIYIESEEPLEIQEVSINIMLSNNYSRWFTTLEKGDFPFIDDKTKNWQALFDSNLSIKCIGVENNKIGDSEIPSLSFEQLNTMCQVQAQILNTDYLNNCRILLYKTSGFKNHLARQANRFTYFSGKIAINIPDVNNYLKTLEDEFVLSNGKTQLIINNGHAMIYHNGAELTKANHMFTSICIDGKWYSSALANWNIKKDEDDNLIAIGSWPGLPIAQIWKMQLKDNNSIIWEIAFRIDSEVNLEKQDVSLMFSEAYKYWLTTYYGRGDFPETFLVGEMAMLQRLIPNGLISFRSDDEILPNISLKLSKELSNYGLIYNSSSYDKARIARIYKAESDTEINFAPGEYRCFFIEISIDKDKKSRLIDDSLNMIENGRLKFIFENGCGRIFWDNVELTKDLCLYTSIRSQGKWRDSAWCAVWELKEKDKNSIRARGKWLYLPIVQEWEIQLLNETTMGFNVKMEITEKIDIESMQTNIMLLEWYTRWLAGHKKGEFPLFKIDVDDNWHWMWSGACGDNCIGVLPSNVVKNEKGKCLPSVLLSSRPENSQCQHNVINSDIYHRGRVLQFLNSEGNTFMPGEYLYYAGVINVDKL